MGRGRPPQKERCIFNKPIGRDHWTSANTGAPGGKASCWVCQAGPLHLETSMCGCSFKRDGLLVCRDCAIGYDLVKYGKSKISNNIGVLDPELLKTIRKGYAVVRHRYSNQ